MTMQWLAEWWNLIFVVPFLLALIYLGIYTVTGISFGDADADADADAEADGDTDGDADGDGDADAHGVAHVALPHGGNVPIHIAVLSFLGLGRVPLSFVLMILLMSWGMIGFISNTLLTPEVAEPWQVPALSLPLAAIGSVLVTRLVSRAIARWIPLNETYAKRRHELLGGVGEVVLPVDGTFGMLKLRDEMGNLFQIPCRIEGTGTINKGEFAKLVAYNGQENLFYVVPCPRGAKATV